MDDVIYREDALERLRSIPADLGRRELDDSIKAIENMPSAQRWIPVEKETPILPNIVIVCDSLGKILFDSYIDGSWTYCPYVVAWMPLPEPYREEAADG